MMTGNVPLAIYAACTFVAYIYWISAVRRGTIRDKAIIWTGLLLGFLSMAAYALVLLPIYEERHFPMAALFVAVMPMGLLSIFCVTFSYRSQLVQDIATHAVGDTKIIVRSAGANRFPDAQAMLLPTTTNLRMADGIAGMVALGTGRDPEKELYRLGPVGMGKVVQTGGGNSGVGHIFHVAVSDALKRVEPERLRRGIESAAQQARKSGAESLVVPLGSLRGLSAEEAAKAIVPGVLRQRKAFAEIVFQVLDSRNSNVVKAVVEQSVEELAETRKAGSLSS